MTGVKGGMFQLGKPRRERELGAEISSWNEKRPDWMKGTSPDRG